MWKMCFDPDSTREVRKPKFFYDIIASFNRQSKYRCANLSSKLFRNTLNFSKHVKTVFQKSMKKT